MRALVAGHVCVDLVPTLNGDIALDAGRLEEVGPLALRAGGCVANTGVALADLGATVRVDALVGADPLGNWLTELVKPLVSDASQLRVRQGGDTSYSIALEPPGSDRMFLHHVGANAVFDGSGVDLRGEDILHLGYLTLLPGLWSDSGAPLREILERAKAAGATTSVDLAVVDRHSAWDWPQLLAGILPLVDIISPSVDDLDFDLSDGAVANAKGPRRYGGVSHRRRGRGLSDHGRRTRHGPAHIRRRATGPRRQETR